MRCGILTYHYAANEGAAWQACALCAHLRAAQPQHRFEIIDYRPATQQAALAAQSAPERLPMYDEILRGCLGGVRLVSDCPEDLFRRLPQSYDAVLVGSDIVWQVDVPRSLPARLRQSRERYGWPRPSVASPYAFARDLKNWAAGVWRGAVRCPPDRLPFPNAYWLAPELPLRKAAVAASIGYADVARAPRAMRREMLRRLQAFDFISVRDLATLDFIRSLDPALGARVRRMPDPAWLWDQPLPDADPILRAAGVPAGSPRAGVLWPRGGGYRERLERWILPVLRSRGFHVVSVIDRNPAADSDLAAQSLSPLAWWSVIRALDFLVTVRTHPTIAALKYGTPVFNVDITAMHNRCGHSKSRDMLEPFGLAEVCLHRRADFNERAVCAGLVQALDRSWDWPAIAAQAERNRQQGVAVLGDLMGVLAAS